MAFDKQKLKLEIKARALDLGFHACGFAGADVAPAAGKRLRAWLADGAHGDMLWMAARAEERADPRALWPEVRSIIMLGMSYAPGRDPTALADAGGQGRISIYAQGADYHDVVKKALKHLARWLVEATTCGVKVFVDTAPVMEKPLAEAAGIGWQGKHTNVVSQTGGSWLFLGAIYTTLDLPPDAPGRNHCGSCTACQDICPTNAFPEPYRLDATACISYLTIENKGPIPRQYRRAMSNHIYGCDDCLAVCPWNKFAAVAQANKVFLPRAELVAPDLADLLALDDAGFRAVFSGSPIKRTGRDRIVRNCLIAAGNSGDLELLPQVLALLDDPADVVRGSAVWALGELDAARFAVERGARMAAEVSDEVRAEWGDVQAG